MATEKGFRDNMKRIFFNLDNSRRKGQMGRVAVIGGSKDYTGAPYFAAYSALRVGADLSHVICVKDAGPIIKSYSADLIVHPILDAPNAVEEISKWLPRCHVVSFGSGLGRDLPSSLIFGIINRVKELSLPMVIDADGIFYVKQKPEIVKNAKFVLTPNVKEYFELFDAVFKQTPSVVNEEDVQKLASTLSTVIVCKGRDDIISDGKMVVNCTYNGSPCRAGGQGDLLSGSTATFVHWAQMAESEHAGQRPHWLLLAAYTGCCFTRHCNRVAFRKLGRSMVTQDMVNSIPRALREISDNVDQL